MEYSYRCLASLDSSYSIHGDCLLENICQSRISRSAGIIDVRAYRKPCHVVCVCLSRMAHLQGVKGTSTQGGKQFLMFHIERANWSASLPFRDNSRGVEKVRKI